MPTPNKDEIRRWWVSVPFATVQVNTISEGGQDRIVEIAPIFHKFINQPMSKLISWLKSKCGNDAVWMEELK